MVPPLARSIWRVLLSYASNALSLLPIHPICNFHRTPTPHPIPSTLCTIFCSDDTMAGTVLGKRTRSTADTAGTVPSASEMQARRD